jgi:hypothetical protein
MFSLRVSRMILRGMEPSEVESSGYQTPSEGRLPMDVICRPSPCSDRLLAMMTNKADITHARLIFSAVAALSSRMESAIVQESPQIDTNDTAFLIGTGDMKSLHVKILREGHVPAKALRPFCYTVLFAMISHNAIISRSKIHDGRIRCWWYVISQSRLSAPCTAEIATFSRHAQYPKGITECLCAAAF